MTRYAVLTLLAVMALAGCGSGRGPKLLDYDSAGVPLGRGKAECKAQAREQAASLAKGDVVNGVADDLYADCLRRRGYLGQ